MKETLESAPSAAATPFGGPSMSNEFKMWCSAQMQSLTASEDLTLIEFLMSLSSAAEIKEYVAQYLGPKVAPDEQCFLSISRSPVCLGQVLWGRIRASPRIWNPQRSVCSCGIISAKGQRLQALEQKVVRYMF